MVGHDHHTAIGLQRSQMLHSVDVQQIARAHVDPSRSNRLQVCMRNAFGRFVAIHSVAYREREALQRVEHRQLFFARNQHRRASSRLFGSMSRAKWSSCEQLDEAAFGGSPATSSRESSAQLLLHPERVHAPQRRQARRSQSQRKPRRWRREARSTSCQPTASLA